MKITEAESDLVKLTATEMAKRVRQREVTSLELVEAHIARIERTHDAINAVVVPLFEQARQQAEHADQLLAKSSADPNGALFGVPITIKEFFDVKGTKTTGGIESEKTKSATSDAAMVWQLRRAGAIVLGKTNVPQLGLAIETENPVYGRTSNPHDTGRSPGGSSGGEAAIIAAHGSPLGLASDGGGSIRIPSHFCGLCGLKPTAGRLSSKGHWKLPSFPEGWNTAGPIARSVEDLSLAMNCFTAPHDEPVDPTIATTSVPDLSQVDVSQLTIGYYEDDQFITPSPAIRRAVREAVSRFESLGAKLVPFEPAPVMEAWQINLGFFYADGGKWMRHMLGSSPKDARVKKTLLLASLPTAVRRSVPRVMESMGQTTTAALLKLSRSKTLSAFGYQAIQQKQQTFRETFYRRMHEQQIDAILCPPFPSVAMKHMSPDIVLGYGYTYVYNLLGLPAGIVPRTTVMAGEESDRTPSKDNFIRDLIRAEVDSVGLPVGVQIVGRHWREDVVMALMQSLKS